jgi:hypothetical protein
MDDDTECNVLQFDSKFNSDINVILPDYIHKIIFSVRFNKDLSNVTWPASLHTLVFGMRFNQDITLIKWPPLLHTLIFGYEYNQDISNLIILSLCVLHFGDMYNHNLSDVKWNEFISLYSLKLSHDFNSDITDIIWPQSMHIITFGYSFKQNIINANFQNIGIIKDYSSRITLDSCKFPRTLQFIIHYEYIDYIDIYKKIVIYERPSGMYTKSAIH